MRSRQLMNATPFAVAAALAAAPALAQQQVNTSGRAHDANPQVGSGGRNSTVGGSALDYRQRNDVITGNVAGGAEFRGEIDYSAPGEFQGELGSDDLFRFRAQSLPSAPNVLGGTAGSVNLGGVPSVYRGFSTPTAGAGTLNATAYNLTRVAPNGGTAGYAQITGTSPYSYTDASQYYRDQAARLGFTTVEGQTLAVTASPLLGIRQDQLPGQSLQVDLGVPSVTPPAALPGVYDPASQPVPTPRLTPEEQAEEAALDPRLQTRLDAQPFRPLLTEDYRQQILGVGPDGLPLGPDGRPQSQQDPMAQRGGGVDESGRLMPTLLMGRQLQGMLGSNRGGEPLDAATEQRINRLGESLMNRAAQAQQQGQQSPYGDVLNAVGNPQATQPQNANRREEPEFGLGTELDPVQEQELAEAEINRLRALDRIYGNRQGDAEAGEGQLDPMKAAQGSQAMQELLQRLNYELPPMQTLAGEDATRVNQLMREAEQKLASGQYFDAESIYRQVMNYHTADPMPRVGLVHAQLGAGMIRSAAVNLRQLFEEHPEVIAARYSANLLPQEERLQWLRGELQRAMGTGEGGAEPGLIMAYLGYQVGSTQLIRYGLATAESRAPRDALLPVLRAIWLDGEAADPATQAEPATPQATPPADAPSSDTTGPMTPADEPVNP